MKWDRIREGQNAIITNEPRFASGGGQTRSRFQNFISSFIKFYIKIRPNKINSDVFQDAGIFINGLTYDSRITYLEYYLRKSRNWKLLFM